MRKSEADLLLEKLEDEYEGDMELRVMDLGEIGLEVPQEEHPYFVVGLEIDEDRDEETPDDVSDLVKKHKQVLKRQFNIVVWDNRDSGWTVKKMSSWQVQQCESIPFRFYIYDTRAREFVPVDKFQIPRSSD